MNPELSPDPIDERVRQIRGFYISLTTYTAVFIICVIAWLAMGGGAFWPIWVFLGCGIAAFSEGLRLDMLPFLSDILPFLKKDWEEKTKAALLKEQKNTNSAKPSKKKE